MLATFYIVLTLLSGHTPDRRVLGAFRYSANATVLHTDRALLPASRAVRASWNYALPSCSATAAQVRVSYSMNRLHRLTADQDYIVTLGGDGQIRRECVLARMDYQHPIYDPASVAAQRLLPDLNDGVTGSRRLPRLGLPRRRLPVRRGRRGRAGGAVVARSAAL